MAKAHQEEEQIREDTHKEKREYKKQNQYNRKAEFKGGKTVYTEDQPRYKPKQQATE